LAVLQSPKTLLGFSRYMAKLKHLRKRFAVLGQVERVTSTEVLTDLFLRKELETPTVLLPRIPQLYLYRS